MRLNRNPVGHRRSPSSSEADLARRNARHHNPGAALVAPKGLWRHRDVLLAFLLGRKGEWVNVDTIIEELWRCRQDGGPVWANSMIKVCVHQLRRNGWNIKTWSNFGYCLVGRSGKVSRELQTSANSKHRYVQDRATYQAAEPP